MSNGCLILHICWKITEICLIKYFANQAKRTENKKYSGTYTLRLHSSLLLLCYVRFPKKTVSTLNFSCCRNPCRTTFGCPATIMKLKNSCWFVTNYHENLLAIIKFILQNKIISLYCHCNVRYFK